MPDRDAAGEATRRAVLGDAHVDAAQAATDAFTEPFQELITRYAWGDVWTRPGLSVAERRMLVIALLAALQHEDELAMHVRAAVRAGMPARTVQEILLQVAVYAGVPTGNRAFRVARRAIADATDGPSAPGDAR